MKICLIGPTYPFRGGISHYTTLLYRYLKKRHDVYFLAFKRQYPNWLFPGKTDKDTSKNPICEDGVENTLDSLNPISWMRVFFRVKEINPELVILPWWVSFWTPQFWTIVYLIKKFTPAKILFICHNVIEHESTRFDKLCAKFVLKKGDYFIVHSGEDYTNLKRFIPEANVKKSFHPIYDVFNGTKFSNEMARRQLHVHGNLILFFGFVRPYKGLDYLIEAIPKIIKHIDITLFIVGEFWKGEQEHIKQIERLKIQDHIKIVNKYVPNEEVGLYFAAADLVVLPYVSATGSGTVQTAFGFNKPVISTNVGCLPEIIVHQITGYIVPPRDSEAITKAVISFYKENKMEEFVENIKKDKSKFSWDRMVETIESFREI